MIDPEMKLAKEDICIEPIEDQTCEHQGDNCTFSVTHRVSVEFRAGGQNYAILGAFCETCATELRKSIQESLPSYDSQEQIAKLLEACQFAAEKFRSYEQLHRAKGTVEGSDKAAVNAAHAMRMEQAIAAVEKGQP